MRAGLEERISRLSEVSASDVVEPDAVTDGRLGDGMVVPRELLTVADLELELTDEQWQRLSREELASLYDFGVRFEGLLMAGLGNLIGWRQDVLDPRVTYILHEVGEETRHSRLFLQLLAQLEPTAEPLFLKRPLVTLDRLLVNFFMRRPPLLWLMVLACEESFDIQQRLAEDHPETDSVVREVSRYHRSEEARHLAFARMLMPELWEEARTLDRWITRWTAPALMRALFETLVDPGVYKTVGLPPWRTWNAARKSKTRVAMRARAFRSIYQTLSQAGAFGPGGRRVPRPWRLLVSPA